MKKLADILIGILIFIILAMGWWVVMFIVINAFKISIKII